MRLRTVMRRVRRLLCMAGMHQFSDEKARCIAPGCRAPKESRRAGNARRQPLRPLSRTPSTIRRLATRKTMSKGRALSAAPAMIGPYDSAL